MEANSGSGFLRHPLCNSHIHCRYIPGNSNRSSHWRVDRYLPCGGGSAQGCFDCKAGRGTAGRHSVGYLRPLGILILNPLMYKLELKIFAGSTTHQFTGGANLISAVLVLAVMILPTVINISESALRAVPKHLKSASLALGATHIQTIFKVLVPAAKSGIVTAIVLGCGRAIGEAMAISLVSGSSVNLPLPFNSVRFLTTAIVAEMSYSQGLHREVLFTVGLVLFAFIMFINTVLTGCSRKEGRKMTSNLSIYNRKVRTSDQVLKGLIYLAAAAAISLLVGIMGYVFIRGLPQLSWQFLSTVQSARKGTSVSWAISSILCISLSSH